MVARRARRTTPLARALIALAAVVVLAVLAFEVHWFAEHIESASRRLRNAQLGWILLALAAEWSSMVAFARLQRTMLLAGGVRVRLSRSIAVAFAANAMSVTLPAGTLMAAAYTFRRMREWGASASLVSFGLAVSGVLSSAALGLLALLGGALAGDRLNPLVITIEVVGLVAVGYLARQVLTQPNRLRRPAVAVVHTANRLRRRDPDIGVDHLQRLIDELATIHPHTGHWVRGLTFATLNWALDLICLIAACRAVGAHGLTIPLALVAYAAGMAASSVPLLPGGIGVVDGALILTLHEGGIGLPTATAGVIVYRLISFVLVAVIGWLAWLALRRHPVASTPDPALAEVPAEAPTPEGAIWLEQRGELD